MTTTITLETHSWPVEVQTSDDLAFDASPTRRGHGYREEYEFVPAHSKRQFYITNTRSIRFRELPQDATSLPGRHLGEAIGGVTACAESSTSQFVIEVAEPSAEEGSSNG